jgi:tryptophanyl-tRNA synthetase
MCARANNTINIFLDDKALRKQIMGIETDSTPLEEPKNPDTCNVFALYRLLGAPEQVASLQAKYEAGNFGYGHAKQALFDLIVEKFSTERSTYNYYINNLEEVDKLLLEGAAKARKVAQSVLTRVREKLGY